MQTTYGGTIEPGMQLPATSARPISLWPVAVAAGVCGMFGFLLAQVGFKGQLIGIGALAFAFGLMLVRERALFGLAILVLSLQFLFHKALGSVNQDIASGAPGIYVTSVDAILLVLYGMWLVEGTLLSDFRVAFRQP